MTDTTNVDISDDLDAFSKDFFNPTAAKETVAETPETVEADDDDTDENPVAHEEDTDAENETDDETTEEESDEDELDEEHQDAEEDTPAKDKKVRKSRARERIEELVTEARVAQRESEALRRRIEELERKVPTKTEETHEEKTVALRDQLSSDAPNPDAVNDKGEPVYPLGEFDPTYIRDLTKFTIAQERKVAQEEEAKAKAEQEIAAAQTELQQNWSTNLEKAKKDLPDIQEKLADLEPVVKNIDPAYGDFLAATIMASEFGPQIMYYLAENIDEAQSIVASGAASATRAIGRLEARFESAVNREDKRNTNKRVSDAPKPPEARTKGNRGVTHVRPDTDDLDAFSREFFIKK